MARFSPSVTTMPTTRSSPRTSRQNSGATTSFSSSAPSRNTVATPCRPPWGGGALPADAAVAGWPTPAANEYETRDSDRMLQRREEIKAKGINGNGFGLTLGMLVGWRAIAGGRDSEERERMKDANEIEKTKRLRAMLFHFAEWIRCTLLGQVLEAMGAFPDRFYYDIREAAGRLSRLENHICGDGYIGCTGGPNCPWDHK